MLGAIVGITVLYFAQAADRAGVDREEVEVEGPMTLAALRARVLSRHAGLVPLAGSLLWAVDEEVVDENARVEAGQTVAVMPPFSGG